MEQEQTPQEEEHIPPDTTDKNELPDSEEQSEQAEAGKLAACRRERHSLYSRGGLLGSPARRDEEKVQERENRDRKSNSAYGRDAMYLFSTSQ